MKVLFEWITTTIIALDLGFVITSIIIMSLGILLFILWNNKRDLNKCIKNLFNRKTCGDKIIEILTEKSKYEVKISTILNSILRDQMNYVEQKIHDMVFLLTDTYNKQQKAKGFCNESTKNKEMILYIESLKNSFCDVKDEIRRSFKENGFHNIGDVEFEKYISDKMSSLLSISRNYLVYHYPHEDMIIRLSERFAKFDQIHSNEFRQVMRDIYINAKNIRIKKELEISNLYEEFSEKVDKMIGR